MAVLSFCCWEPSPASQEQAECQLLRRNVLDQICSPICSSKHFFVCVKMHVLPVNISLFVSDFVGLHHCMVLLIISVSHCRDCYISGSCQNPATIRQLLSLFTGKLLRVFRAFHENVQGKKLMHFLIILSPVCLPLALFGLMLYTFEKLMGRQCWQHI